MKLVGLPDVYSEMEWFWGDEETRNAPSTNERKSAIVEKMCKSVCKIDKPACSTSSTKIIKGAEVGGKVFELQLMFRVGSVEICEAAYLRLIGHKATKMWIRLKKETFATFSRNGGHIREDDMKDIEAAIKTKKDKSEQRARPKSDHATTFIKYFAQFHSSLSPNEGGENIHILPFETVSQLFAEYNAYCKSNDIHRSQKAGRTVFNSQWKECYNKKEVKFTRGKGTFPTCDICNNANDMLSLAKSNSRWNKRQREIIINFKVKHCMFFNSFLCDCFHLLCCFQSHHLKQQAIERAALEGKKHIARTDYTEDGMPKEAVIFGDGMTKYATKTPKYGRKQGKKETAYLENRVFGVEVHCGPISGEILVHTDELVRGGANFTIEVHRLGKL